MKFITKCGIFRQALSTISGLNDKRCEEEYLKQVLINVDEEFVSLTSMAGGAIITHKFEPDPDALIKDVVPGGCVVELGRLIALLSTYEREDNLNFILDKDEKVRINVGTEGEFLFHSRSISVFPDPEAIEPLVKYSCSNNNLKRSISLIKQCMAERDTRAYLNGMLFEFDIDGINLVATNSHCLGVASIKDATPEGNRCGVKSIVSNKHIDLLIKKLKAFDENTVIISDNSKIQFKSSDTSITFCTVDAVYPEYKNAIPKRSTNKMHIKIKRTIALFERIKLMSNKDINGVEVHIERDVMSVKSSNKDNEQGIDSIDVEYEGESQVFGVNADFIVNQLESAKREGVNDLTFTKGTDFKDAILFEPCEEDHFLYVISPMRI